MKALKWLDRYGEVSLMILLLAVSSVVVFLQIIMRFIFQNSLTWSEELARYLFIWMIYIAMSYGVKKSSHLRVDALDSLLTERQQIAIEILVQILVLAFVLIMSVFGLSIVLRSTRASAALEISMKWIYLAPVVGMVGSTIRSIQNLFELSKRYQDKGVRG